MHFPSFVRIDGHNVVSVIEEHLSYNDSTQFIPSDIQVVEYFEHSLFVEPVFPTHGLSTHLFSDVNLQYPFELLPTLHESVSTVVQSTSNLSTHLNPLVIHFSLVLAS